MKLVRFGPAGAEKPGLVDADGALRDASALVRDIDGAFLSRLDGLALDDIGALPIVEGQPRLGPCVTGVGKFIGIGLNYADHAAESGVPSEPIVFLKANSSLSGPNDAIRLPAGAAKTDWEVELGVVIGQMAHNVGPADALRHVAGYCIVNDVSERSWQLEGTGQWTKGKSADSFGPIGPWLVTADEIADPQALGMWLEVNGVRKQTGSTATMIFSVAEVVSYLSRLFTLHPGDLITTGTPPGVGMGMTPPQYLRPGDRVQLGIDGLGAQDCAVITRDTARPVTAPA